MAETIPLSVPDDLLGEVKETARLTNLSVQDVFHQSVKMAAPVLRQSTRTELPARRSVWDALASGAGLELRADLADGAVENVSL